MKITLVYLFAALLGCSSCHSEISHDENLVSLMEMQGNWQVTDVLTDTKQFQKQGLEVKYLLPLYLGRIFTISDSAIVINSTVQEACLTPKLIENRTDTTKLFSKSFDTRFPEKTKVTAQDMGLLLKDNTEISAFYLSCNGAMLSKYKGLKVLDDNSNAIWLIRLDQLRYAISWHDETLLVLERVKDDAKPVASFDCAKATTTVEKTICGNVGLAAYDKSLSQSYKQVLDYYLLHNKIEANKLKQSQVQWLMQRNKCGNKLHCLETQMEERIDNLIYGLADYMYINR